MALVTDLNIVSALRAAATKRGYIKASLTTEGAGLFQSLWKAVGQPGAGANPPLFSAGAGYIPTKATVGAFDFTNGSTDGHLALLRMDMGSSTAGSIIIADRLWACSGFGTVITTAQVVTTPGTLPIGRDPNNGLDVEPWLEFYTAPGATGATWTVTGTDGLGNTARTWTYTHPANAETVGQMVPLLPGGASPAAVSTMRQLTQFICSATSGTAGDVGVTLLRRLPAATVLIAGVADSLDVLRTGAMPIYNDSCLFGLVACTTTNTGSIMGQIVIGEGA